MDYASTRELVRLRHELRRLMAERPAGSREVARAMLARLAALVAADEEDAALLAPDLARWAAALNSWSDNSAEL